MVWSHQPFGNNYYASFLHPSRIVDFRKFIPRSRSGAPEPQYSGWATRVTLGIKVTNSKPALCCDQGLLPALRAIGPVVGTEQRRAYKALLCLSLICCVLPSCLSRKQASYEQWIALGYVHRAVAI